MEKLIELVYKYNEEKEWEKIWLITSVKEWECEIWFDKEKEIRKYENYIISKKYWFIKWLVENDKINWRKCLDLWYEISVIDEEWEDVDIMRTFDSYEQLLMYLSIQDNPIEFLVSILK
jgi:hypothetical protein